MRRLSVCLLALCLPLANAHAQYTAGKIVFKGDVPYAQADMQAASGLKPGQPVSNASLQAAAQQLSDTGAFGDLEATFDGPMKSITVLFKVKPPEQFIPATFQNFVWWSDADLVALLHQRVPLFSGRLPEAGNLKESVRQVLVALLEEKGVKATVTGLVRQPSPGQPTPALEYTIDTPDIQLAAFDLQSATPGSLPSALTPELQTTIAHLVGKPYEEGPFGAREKLLTILRDEGYLDASLDHLSRNIRSTTPDVVTVALTATLNPGQPYTVSTLTWPGTPVAPADICAGKDFLHAGDLAAHQRLQACLTKLQSRYRQAGFLDAAVTAQTDAAPAQHQVAYTLHVEPGAPYLLRSVTAHGLSPAQHAEFDRNWLLQPGFTYDGDYPVTFLKKNIAQPFLRDYTASFVVAADPATHQVDLTINFKPTSRS